MAGTGNSGGRNKKGTTQHVLQGTFRPDRHDAMTPQAPSGKPEQPKDLEGDALAEWERMTWRLTELGTLSKVDDAAIYQYARLFGETEQHAVSREECAATVQILEENIGGLQGADLVAAFQEITKMRKLELSHATATRQGRMAIRQYLVEFGMTPAARSRVKLPADAKPKLDPLKERYFGVSGR